MDSYVVIGGGLAGLTAANALAGHGRSVTLLEQSGHPGGRARTQRERGYLLNMGPHALYRGERAARTFREWGISLSGGFPPGSPACFVRGKQFHPIFRGPVGLLGSRMFGLREKVAAAKMLRLFTLARAEPRETMSQWFERQGLRGRVREFGALVARISSFTPEMDRLDAGMALRRIASSLRHNVLFLDGGWQTLVDGLVARAESKGVAIRCGEQVRSLDRIDATGIVLAVGPRQVEVLTGEPVRGLVPARMASLDLGVSAMAGDTVNVAFGIDRPLYLASHSASAKLAPTGGRMVHVAKYLGSEAQDPNAVRAELEDFADLTMPGWRKHLEFARFLPDLTVTAGIPTPAGRPGVVCGRVAIAGDWVGGEGMLADAAVASALEAAGVVAGRKAIAA